MFAGWNSRDIAEWASENTPERSSIAPLMPLLTQPPDLLQLIIFPHFALNGVGSERAPAKLFMLRVSSNIAEIEAVKELEGHIRDFGSSFARVTCTDYDQGPDYMTPCEGWTAEDSRDPRLRLTLHPWESQDLELLYKKTKSEYYERFRQILADLSALGWKVEGYRIKIVPFREVRSKPKKRFCGIM